MIINTQNTSFKGYDAIPLRAFYMQGIKKRGEAKIFSEMKNIAKKEGLDIFLNQDCEKISSELKEKVPHVVRISLWGQDNKAFIKNKDGKIILWNGNESPMIQEDLGELSDFKIDIKNYFPRGGNYYLGYKPNGEKWLIINSMSVTSEEGFEKYFDMPTKKHLCEKFDVKPENICMLTDIANDIDEVVRPIGYPYILVNDYKLSLKNLEKMKRSGIKNPETYYEPWNYINKMIQEESTDVVFNCDEVCNKLKKFGFKPIRIGGRYNYDINYMNALAFQNNRGGISYITNSTKGSYPELEYLEKLFEKDLRGKVPKISDTYFVSGGKRTEREKNSNSYSALYGRGLKDRNVIMDILANRQGGIHCMTAEVPRFDKIV